MRKSSGIIITVIQASSIMYSVHSPNTYVLFYTGMKVGGWLAF